MAGQSMPGLLRTLTPATAHLYHGTTLCHTANIKRATAAVDHGVHTRACGLSGHLHLVTARPT